MDLDRIRTIVVVMMENRSFDHLLGYLSLEGYGRTDVDGLKSDAAWLDQVANAYNGQPFPPFQLDDPFHVIDADPPHERPNIANQLGANVSGVFAMNGFVANYAGAKGQGRSTTQNSPPVMGYFGPDDAPVMKFFTENFRICDHWFCSLPAGTQPNRLMAMSGFTRIDTNQVPLPDQELIYDWLTRNGVRWRVYHEGMPFFAMMPRWIDDVVMGNRFRPLRQFSYDVENEPPAEFPQVIFVEPTYSDCPHIGIGTDDHAPSAIKGGQKFLLEVYRDMIADPAIWDGMVMVIVTYDEHGGFFDHVSPPALRTDPPGDALYNTPFETLGVRVPAFVISPFVEAGTVFNQLLDHTSILCNSLAKNLAPAGAIPMSVDRREVGSVTDAPERPGFDPHGPNYSIAQRLSGQGDGQQRRICSQGAAPETRMERSKMPWIRSIPSQEAEDCFSDLLEAFPE